MNNHVRSTRWNSTSKFHPWMPVFVLGVAPFIPPVAALFMVLGLAVASGCQGGGESRARPELAREGEAIFASPAARPGAAKSAAGSEAWSIVIAAIDGDGAETAARNLLAEIRTRAGLKDAFVEARGARYVVSYGSYAGPADRAAQADLERIKAIEIDGVRPFAMAQLAPPIRAGTVPEFDLRNARRIHGTWALYSLQIGVYSREDGRPPSPDEMREFRRMAEEAVAQLRREGEEAFYYHGPNRSMVTVGLFGTDDFDPQSPGPQSPRLSALRERYPNNLLNGRGIRERREVTTTAGRPAVIQRLQPSFLVQIPDS